MIVGVPVEEGTEGGGQLKAGERCPGAEVDSRRERQVSAGIASEIQLIGSREAPIIAVG